VTDQQPFADVVLTEAGYTLPSLKWRELLFIGALRDDGGAFVRDTSRPLPPFRASGLFPPGMRLRAVLAGDRVAVSREDGRPLCPAAETAAPFLHADVHLARRLEAAEAAGAAAAAETLLRIDPSSGAAVLGVGGGVAAFLGVGSPLTHAMGVGVAAPVAPAALDSVEAFYRERRSGALFELSPLADFGLFEELGRRGYRIVELATLLARGMAEPPAVPAAGVVIEAGARERADLWVRTLALGFHGKDEDPAMRLAGRVLAEHAGPGALLAFVEGRAAGGGALAIHAGVACFFADATLAEERGRGVQSALIAHRLALAAGAGCDLAMATTAPGSVSQRNYERAGFRVVYTRVCVLRDPA
jgi:GNAT superfamily N-acetyltransferase